MSDVQSPDDLLAAKSTPVEEAEAAPARIPLSRSTRRVIATARGMARQMGLTEVTSDILLLAMYRTQKSSARQILRMYAQDSWIARQIEEKRGVTPPRPNKKESNDD